MGFLIAKAIVVLLLAMVLVVTYALCRVSGSAERKYQELVSKHFTSIGGEDSEG